MKYYPVLLARCTALHTSWIIQSQELLSFQTNNPLSREVNNYPVYTNTKDNNWQARSSHCSPIHFFRITSFHVVVVQQRQEMYKKSMMHKVLFDQSKPLAFLPFSLPSPSSLRKLPTMTATATGTAKKPEVQIGKTTTLQEHHAFLHISLPSLHDYNVKLPNFTFCRGREKKTTTFFFSFPELWCSSLKFNFKKNLPTFDELNQVE